MSDDAEYTPWQVNVRQSQVVERRKTVAWWGFLRWEWERIEAPLSVGGLRLARLLNGGKDDIADQWALGDGRMWYRYPTAELEGELARRGVIHPKPKRT